MSEQAGGQKQFELECAHPGSEPVVTRREADERVKRLTQLVRRGELDARPWRKFAVAQERAAAAAGEIDEIFRQSRFWRSLDLVTHTGPVAEDRAGGEGVSFTVEHELTAARSDEFNGKISERLSVDRVIRRTFLPPATHDAQRFAGLGTEVVIETARRRDLLREE